MGGDNRFGTMIIGAHHTAAEGQYKAGYKGSRTGMVERVGHIYSGSIGCVGVVLNDFKEM